MIEMTLSSRHRIQNSSPGGLRPSTLPLGHGGSPRYWLSHVDSGVKGSGANHYPRAPAQWQVKVKVKVTHKYFTLISANKSHWPNAGSMLVHRLRRWPNIEPATGESIVLAGWALILHHIFTSAKGGYVFGRVGLFVCLFFRLPWARLLTK